MPVKLLTSWAMSLVSIALLVALFHMPGLAVTDVWFIIAVLFILLGGAAVLALAVKDAATSLEESARALDDARDALERAREKEKQR